MEKEIHPMILEFTTKKNNKTIKLPLSGDSLNVEIDWGDGSPVETVTRQFPTHKYIKKGVYEVKISGTVPRIDSFYLSDLERQYLTGIKSWGKLNGLTLMECAFWYCDNLRGELPNDEYSCFENITDFNSCFSRCSGLTSIPEKLFSNCPNVTDFDNCFYGCAGLTSIPEKLFSNCPNVTDFDNCFYGCSGLTSIPENLFVNCPNVTNFSGCFYGCSGLTSIPENLFANCPNVTDFVACFSWCTGLTGSIPENLFANCPNVTSFWGCFEECSGLTGNIPEGLFSNCPNVINFEWCFCGCTGLTGTTPVDILEDGTRVELWERVDKEYYPSYYVDGLNCFKDCIGLSNYLEIPDEWKLE